MSHPWAASARFWQRLITIDEQIAERARAMGCQRCGGPLHRADYPRKPRGELGEAEEAFSSRRSFCCGRCRRRATPPSVRFLGRKVYVGELVVTASRLWQQLRGLVGRQVAGVPRRTVSRWLGWWQKVVPATSFWSVARALLMPPVEESQLPRSLVERFAGSNDYNDDMVSTLVFVTPLTTESARYVRVDVAHAEDGVSQDR